MKSRFDKEILQELALIEEEAYKILEKNNKVKLKMLGIILDIMEANAKIWENEAAIRKEYDEDKASSGSLDLVEIGKRALAIRDYNKIRLEGKSKIDVLMGQVSKEKKIDHISS